MDDVHEFAGTHASASIVPAAFAIAEYSKVCKGRMIDGKTLITSITLGADVNYRIRMAGREEGPEMGWVGETYAPLAVALMGARMLDLSPTATANAVGISYAQCAANAQANVDGASTVALQQGFGAKAGILSVLLADFGLTGAKNILLGKYGLYPLYLRGNFHPDLLTEGLGQRFEILNATTKFYPCCQGNHAAIYGAGQLADEQTIKSEEIDRATIRTNTFFATILGTQDKVRPQSVHDAQFSYYYTVASMLVRGRVGLEDFTYEAIADPAVLSIAERITVIADGEKDRMQQLIPPMDIEILMKNGTRYEKTVPFVKGHPLSPATIHDYVEKFDNCIRFSAKPLSKMLVDEGKQMIHDLDTLDDVTRIISNLS
jgi:2-methylcitrate dehydratase PrpD